MMSQFQPVNILALNTLAHHVHCGPPEPRSFVVSRLQAQVPLHCGRFTTNGQCRRLQLQVQLA